MPGQENEIWNNTVNKSLFRYLSLLRHKPVLWQARYFLFCAPGTGRNRAENCQFGLLWCDIRHGNNNTDRSQSAKSIAGRTRSTPGAIPFHLAGTRSLTSQTPARVLIYEKGFHWIISAVYICATGKGYSATRFVRCKAIAVSVFIESNFLRKIYYHF